MSDTFNYSLLKKDDGNYVLRSTLTSYGLQQITDKDIVAFYKHFSSYAYFDTGLLPLDGTGVLSIRSAGEHMQISVQHAPGSYHINWGDTENDKNAKTYYLAQPYRIVIGDFLAGNLLGAKMFYSPVPITHPDQPLYHVNLPNINCKGYRGNAVGWICLYLRENWSQYSFNEKVTKLIERCSGVETYNDANMSETDGPRFYKEKYDDNSDLQYLWSPSSWQTKTESEGFQWTLNQDLWIKVLVKDIDTQDKHYKDGIPLTFAMSVLGNYQAYYSDKALPKLYNMIARQDLSFENKNVAGMFKSSFALTPVMPLFESKDNPFTSSVENREKTSLTTVATPSHNDNHHDNGDSWDCSCCGENYEDNEDCTFDVSEQPVCTSCIGEHYIYLETPSAYYHKNDTDNIYYSDNLQTHIHLDHDRTHTCYNCGYGWGFMQNDSTPFPVYQLNSPYTTSMPGPSNQTHEICHNCIEAFAHVNGFTSQVKICDSCSNQSEYGIVLSNSQVVSPVYFYSYTNPIMELDGSFKYQVINQALCVSCLEKKKGYVTCPCGLSKSILQETFVVCDKTVLEYGANFAEVTKCCQSCIGDFSLNAEQLVVGKFVPFNIDLFNYTLAHYLTLQANKLYGSVVHSSIESLDL